MMTASVLVSCATRTGKQTGSSAGQLYSRLSAHAAAGKKLYGHQDDLPYGHAWVVTDWENDPLERSDVKEVSGHYPAVVGFDLGGIEHADSCNLDGVPFGLMRKAAVTHAGRGGIVTLSWHPRNPLTGGDAFHRMTPALLNSLLQFRSARLAAGAVFLKQLSFGFCTLIIYISRNKTGYKLTIDTLIHGSSP